MSSRISPGSLPRLRKSSGGVATCLVALLALLALEDITTGVQPGFLLEWLMVAFASVWFLAVGFRTWKRRQIQMRSTVGAGFLVAVLLLAASVAPVLAGADDGLRVVEAAERQDWDAVRALVDSGADVTATQPDGATALHWAAHWNDAETAGRLIAAGADVDAVNDLGVPPLWIALDSANVDVALRLIDAGADPNTRLPTGETMLMTAAQHGLGTIVARLLERGADARLAEHERGQTALMWAAAGGHTDVVRRLLESGGGVRARTTGRFTALMFAARSGDLETVQLLLEAGADLEARAIDGNTPLLVASRSTDALAGIDWRIIPYASGHEETALYLMERGADVTAADRLGRTALHAAVETNRSGLAAALIEAGADVDARFTEPVAALRGDYISRRPYKGATAFWLAARAANLEMMRVLLDAGADPFLPNAFGTTPLMVASGLGENDARRAADHRVVETVALLIRLGADVTATTPAGTTALHGAAAMWEDGVIQLLVDHGADVNAEDNRGRTPLHLVEYGNANAPSESTAELLRALGAREPVVEQ